MWFATQITVNMTHEVVTVHAIRADYQNAVFEMVGRAEEFDGLEAVVLLGGFFDELTLREVYPDALPW